MAKSYFIFVANDVQMSSNEKASAFDIADALLARGFWAFTAQAPLQAKLAVGDEVLIYLAGPKRRHFVAVAQVASQSDEVTEEQKNILKDFGLSFMRYSISLRNILRLEPFVEIKPLISDLRFISDKQNYGLHLRRPIVRIEQEDFYKITGKAKTLA